MNPSTDSVWLMLSCDSEGNVGLLMDHLGICGRCGGELRFEDIVDQGSREKALRMLEAMREDGLCSDWELNVPTRDGVKALHFSAAASRDGYLIAASGDEGPEYGRSELARINNEQANLLRSMARELHGTREGEPNGEMYDEISRLNNELVNAHRELTRKNMELERVNEEKSILLGMAAHDIRNPLGNIRNMSQYVLDELQDRIDGVSREFLGHMVSQSDHLLQLLNDLLDISAIQSGKLTLKTRRVDLTRLVEGRVKLQRPFAEAKNQPVHLELGDEPLECEVDPGKVGQVVDNLMTNAVKYSHEGRNITVRLDQKDDMARLQVEDRGVGMRTDDLEKLFTPFAKLHSSPTAGEISTGLGLVVVKRIVEGHGGSVHVQSAVGEGTVFSVFLPLTAADSPTENS